jgi:fructosamine-3-kinase
MSNQLPLVIQNHLQEAEVGEVIHFEPVAGGCISHGGKLTTKRGSFFLKWNDLKRLPDLFEAEAKGLTLLAATGTLRTPVVGMYKSRDKHQWLLLEWIEAAPMATDFWEQLGRGLAFLHRQQATHFGLDHNNYIGSLPQSNRQHLHWHDFFWHERLLPQTRLLANPAWTKKIEAFAHKLPEIFPPERPSFLHGDLWRGNLLVDERGLPCVIDPAVYYGHREAELAFTQLFGGFDNRFFDAYVEAYPLQPGFDKRLNVYNLYPSLVHANLFGGSYLRQAERIIAGW